MPLKNIDSTVLNEYASIVGLFFFSLFPERLALYGDNDERFLEMPFGTFFNDPSILHGRGHIDAILRFLLNEPIRKPGLHMTSQLKNEFLRGSGKYGLDLAAIIIQMGRDHGIPGYTAFRSSCGLRRPSNFSDLGDIVLNSFDVSRLSQLYADIDDVDLFVLGLAEKPQRGALVGPTFACIIGKQFQKTRRGDRFWYENFFTPSAFTTEQLNEIRRTSLARILCDNADSIHKIQQNVFILADNFGNCPMQCNSTIIDHVDFSKWADQEPRLKLPITKATLEKAIRLGAEHAKRLSTAEAERISRQAGGGDPNKNTNSAIFTHSSLMAPKRESLRLSHQAAVLRETTKVLIRGEGLEKDERLPAELDLSTLQRLLPEVDVSRFVGNISDFLDSPAKEECLPQPLPCDHTTKYRTFSGWCNNLKFPHYGNAFAPMRRLLDPVYDDGFDSPRTLARNGRKLPSARVVSNAIHYEAPEFHVKYTHMLMQIGQIIDHDFAHSPVSRAPGNTILNCSRCDSPRTLSVHCFPIPIERGDPHFPHTHSNGEPRCLSFARSLLGQLTLGYRNQLDQLTSYIDASFIYGSTECEANSLRLFSQGRLNFTDLGFNKEALPQGAQERDCRSGPKYPCFNAGDERNNEQPGLTVMHTIFLREHNRIATVLNRINNFWPDETIYLVVISLNFIISLLSTFWILLDGSSMSQ
uniref:Heme peroxidase n=1 Tax=Ascaris lumbricoides TaxID=6252 RepID=A0A9J2PI79_ASCLU